MADLDRVLEILKAHPEGLERSELLNILRNKWWPHLQWGQLENFLQRAGKAIRVEGSRLFAAQPTAPVSESAAEEPPPPLRRFVAFDLESIVRPTVTEPYKEQHVFQIGAVRFGPDREWTEAAPTFNAYMALSTEEDELLIHRDDVRARYVEHKEPAAEVLPRFQAYCDGADALVAYNGVGHDFRLLEREYERCGLPLPWGTKTGRRLRLVDGLYLAQALWPIPPRQHRLAELLRRLALKVDDLVWHDALDDAKMLVELLTFAAQSQLPRLDRSLLQLLRSVGVGSDAWELLFSLSGLEVGARPFGAREIGQIIADALRAAGRRELRPRPAASEDGVESSETGHTQAAGGQPVPGGGFAPPMTITRGDGDVDVDLLVRAVQGDRAEERPAQRRMAEQLREWISRDRPALVEAPTGTGKSYALLAAALDWLAADPANKVVISTYTKQLQRQLAQDIERLGEAAVPELPLIADMVKGAANRLSLRTLAIALADLTDPGPQQRRRGTARFVHDQRYRDLVIYLLLRFLAEGKPTEEWEARSVDPVDVPGFFEDYCRPRLSLYLASLSQADGGDYPPGRADEIARYTMDVREALASRRLIVANHALLLAHHDAFAEIGRRTLLFVDEAQELENAATQAMSRSFDSGLLARLAEDVGAWLADQPQARELGSLEAALEDLERYLEDERLQRAALGAFDTAEHDPIGRTHVRRVTVASPLQGDAHVAQMEYVARELREVERRLSALRRALGTVPGSDDPFEEDRLVALRIRTRELHEALRGILADIDAVLTPTYSGTQEAGQGEPEEAEDAEGLIPVDETEEGDELVAVEGDEDPGTVLEEVLEETQAPHPAPRPNRVVWAEELEELRPGRERWYRFRIVSSPIELGREESWGKLRATFPRTYYVSATLRVAGRWDFIRDRLALREGEVQAVELPSPFDAGRQAELVCFEDFPSWAEHESQAMRTIAHQLSGYARQILDGNQNGVMVLTTSRAAAAGIFDWLARLRVRAGGRYPLLSAGLEGNQRAVEAFRREGGILVGTRGLWQGVDVAEPERLRMVWINKLPFPSFTDPVIAARRELVRQEAERGGAEDPDAVANERYYLPLAALALRQAVGRLIRSTRHRGVIVISDGKLGGPGRLRRLYRQVFLGSLDPGLLRDDPETGERGLGNVCTMREGWRRILAFFAREGILNPQRAAELSRDGALEDFTELPETVAVLREEMRSEEEQALREAGPAAFADELVARCARIAGHLSGRSEALPLKEKQEEAIRALGAGKDVLAVLPTGYGKSYLFQLPALALPGVTIVVSPLVSLMTDQALELNRTIGGRVRALVAPMRESNSRTGKSEVQEELTGARSHGIKLVYLSPERLCQRQFQDWIRAGVERGIVRRIAVDEAHTFVQWGDDFRPSVRRAARFLRDLKARHPDLRLLVLTATANATVREELQEMLLGLRPGEQRPDVARVAVNPLRPELALYRRTLPGRQGGPASLAGLIERVVDAIEGHAIFYCLTVRHVDQVYAHLSDYLQGHPVDVYRYHGRMTDAEKTAVANAFRSAPQRGEDDFRRMVVVATSAFGLGIDRPDVRVVFCVSPPTDLAALYQQLGRAGRDRAARAGGPGEYTAGLVLMYPRAQRTLTFMTRRRNSNDLFARAAGALLAADSPLSARAIAEDLIEEDLRTGRLTRDQGADLATLDVYHTVVLRVFAELSARGAVSDLGDFPERITIRPGDYQPPPEMAPLVEAVLEAVGGEGTVEVAAIHQRLGPCFPEELPDPGALWTALLDMHTLGYLDVSQRPNRRWLTAVEFHSREFPPDLLQGLSRRQQQIDRELEHLRDFFESTDCVNEDFRRYFGVAHLPDGTCASADSRCSTHWNRARIPPGEEEPALYEAFMATDLRPASASGQGRRRSERQLDELVRSLLWHIPKGLGENLILAVLRGEDHYFNKTEGRRQPLWPTLLLSRVRGRKPGLRLEELRASLSRLEAAGQLVREGGLWKLLRQATGAAASPAGGHPRPEMVGR